ncbi:MAG: DctP family TRAP transporter solute-binding subunit [Betaproteobacteria bacterium]
MKKLLGVAVLVLLVCSIASSTLAAPVVIRVGIGFNDKTAQYKALEVFKKELEEKSKGYYRVDLYHSSQLGDDRVMMENLRIGNQEMTCPATAPVAGFVKEMKVLDLPYLFPDNEVMHKVLSGPVGRKLLDRLDAAGLHGLVYLPEGFRNLTNSVREVRTPDDLKGLKIRTMENPIHMEAFRLWGASPTPMPFGEVFSALEQRVVAGQENPTSVAYLQKFYEVQKYYSHTEHFAAPYILMISKKFWDAQTPQRRKMIQDAAQQAYVAHKKISADFNNEYLEKMKGVLKVAILTPAEKAEFRKKAAPLYERVKKELGEDFVQEFIDAVEAASK